jgi:hypothetical protein
MIHPSFTKICCFDGIHVHCQEEELKRGELEADKDKMMREYRAQLDAERAQKLANGRNHSRSNSKSSYFKINHPCI